MFNGLETMLLQQAAARHATTATLISVRADETAETVTAGGSRNPAPQRNNMPQQHHQHQQPKGSSDSTGTTINSDNSGNGGRNNSRERQQQQKGSSDSTGPTANSDGGGNGNSRERRRTKELGAPKHKREQRIGWPVYNEVLRACERTGEAALALRLVRGMRARGMAVDVVMYGAAMGACSRAVK